MEWIYSKYFLYKYSDTERDISKDSKENGQHLPHYGYHKYIWVNASERDIT